MPVRTTALIAAFIPGASPPDVSTPIFVTLLSKILLNYRLNLFFAFFKKVVKNTHLALLI
jgi:hypothetical protein